MTPQLHSCLFISLLSKVPEPYRLKLHFQYHLMISWYMLGLYY